MKIKFEDLIQGDVFHFLEHGGGTARRLADVPYHGNEYVALSVERGIRSAPFVAQLNAPSHWHGPKTDHACSQCDTRDCQNNCPMVSEGVRVTAVLKDLYDSGEYTKSDHRYYESHPHWKYVARVGNVSAQLGLF